MMADQPIPEAAELNSSTRCIRECGEPVIQLQQSSRIRILPAYHARGFVTADSSIYLRVGVIEALRRASMKLPEGMCMVVYDGLRTLQTQQEIAARFARELGEIDMSERERNAVLSRFVAPLPRTENAYRSEPPSHCTGGAVDVGLAACNGELLDLGAEFDQFDDAAALTYYEDICRRHKCSEADRTIRDRRRILYWSMTSVGFVSYSAEYWHFERGTQREAALHRREACYGPVAPWPQNWIPT